MRLTKLFFNRKFLLFSMKTDHCLLINVEYTKQNQNRNETKTVIIT